MITKMEVFSEQPSAPILPLGGFVANDDPVQLRNAEGLGPVKADITTTPFASARGAVYQGSSVSFRNIVLTLGLNPDWTERTVASLRNQLYAYFMTQAWVKLRFFSDELPTVEIEGYVESFEPNIFSQDPEIQVSIICPKPDFIEIDATIYNGVVDDGTIELVFDYAGTLETGFELRVERTVDYPTYTGALTIVNKAPVVPQTFSLDTVTINTAKYFKFSSVPNNKRVQNVDYDDGNATNLLGHVSGSSVWPLLKPGENVFSIAAAVSGQIWTLAYFARYGGL